MAGDAGGGMRCADYQYYIFEAESEITVKKEWRMHE